MSNSFVTVAFSNKTIRNGTPCIRSAKLFNPTSTNPLKNAIPRSQLSETEMLLVCSPGCHSFFNVEKCFQRSPSIKLRGKFDH